MVPDLLNITCGQFASLSDGEKRLFVIGVANGRGMTAGLFEAYAGAAQDMARDVAEREGIATGYQTIRELMEPLLGIDATSLLNGLRAACARPELRDKLVSEAFARVHLDAARALRDWKEQQ